MHDGGCAGSAAFLAAARDLLGPAAVAVGDAIARDWCRATVPVAGRPIAVLSVRMSDDVAPLLGLAARHGVPVHPVSRGRNQGFGSRLPPCDAVVLDLSGLDRILAIDMEAGTARLEPGVTFAALQDRLARDGLAWHLPSFGGPTDASVLANALERGEGSGRMGDRFGALWDLDVALTTGERFRTGHARCGAGALSALHARPAGPLVEGLFSQSALGVVLSGRIALQPTMAHGAMITAEIGAPDRLEAAVPVLRRLVSSGLVHAHAISLWDGAKRAASQPGPRLAPTAPGLTDWGVSLTVTAPHPDLMALTARIVDSELAGACHGVALQDDRDRAGRRVASTLTGFSSGANMVSAYAGMAERPAVAGNPDVDGCGFAWLCPALAFEAAAIRRLQTIVRDLSAPELFPAIGLQAVSARALHGYVSLAWDRGMPGADEAAMAAEAGIWRAFRAEGFAPYRSGLRASAGEPDGDWPAVLRRLGRAFDPAGILSPGRLLPG